MPAFYRVTVSVFAALGLTSCFSTSEGLEPPLNRLYFPVGMAMDAEHSRMFVVNSNYDLQFNGGTLQTYDLERLRQLIPKSCGPVNPCDAGESCAKEVDRDLPAWCVKDPAKPCGALDEKTHADRLLYPGLCSHVNPSAPQDGSEPVLVQGVKIGAFGSDIIFRKNPDPGGSVAGRLFVPVRGDSTLHWLDVAQDGRLDCGQSGESRECDDYHRSGDDPDQENTRGLRMPPEPFWLDATERGDAIVVSHQTEGKASLFVNDWQDAPKLQFFIDRLPSRPIGVAAVPVPLAALNEPAYQPGFLLTFRDAAQIQMLRYNADQEASPARPYLSLGGAVDVSTNSVGFDSRGIAIDAEERQSCESKCALGDSKCQNGCAGLAFDIYVANRTPASLLVGKSRHVQGNPPSDDLPSFSPGQSLPFGPSRVVVGNVIGPDNKLAKRVFVTCFDTDVIFVYDPIREKKELEISTGHGPHAFVVDVVADNENTNTVGHAFGYVAHFTDSYIGVVDLDQRHDTYGTIVLTLGRPTPPRASK